MWSKIEKPKTFNGMRPLRESPAVYRGAKSGAAFLVVPQGVTDAKSADIYTDGNGKLAFKLGDKGAYTVNRVSKASKATRITIPKQYAGRVPYGTTACTLSQDGGMLVLDLNQFGLAAAAE